MSQSLQEQAPAAWQRWDYAALDAACDLAAAQGEPGADVAYWRALACVMRESADALAHLELAHAGHLALGRADSAGVDALLAVTLCLLDIGALDQLQPWLSRLPAPGRVLPKDRLSVLWWDAGRVAQAVLDGGDVQMAADAAAALRRRLLPLCNELSPDERLMVAQLLVNYHFHAQQFEQFDWLSAVVQAPSDFERAAPLSRARWLYHLGFALYQVGEHERAEAAWQRALAGAEAAGLHSMAMLAALAWGRLLLDAQRLDEAERIVASIQPQWGGGRTAQLIQLQQIRARLQLLRRQPARAYATLSEALALADASAVSAGERASCLSDLAQVLIALQREDEAQALLERLAQQHEGRNAQVFRCLGLLLAASRAELLAPAQRRAQLDEGMALAQQIRYPMFFRLLPELAARLCALALQWEIAPVFVAELVRSRGLPAPADAGPGWPWVLRVRLMGAFELQGTVPVQPTQGKTQHKPLELLRLMACSRHLGLGMQQAMDALWPEAEGDAARKSLEMAVQRLRRLLGDASLVQVADGRVALDPTRVSSDLQLRRTLIERLETMTLHAAQNSARDSAVLGPACVELVGRILALTDAELLPGAPAAPWLEAERLRARQETVRAALAASGLMAQLGMADEDIRLLAIAHGIEPMSEVLARRLMLAHERRAQIAEIGRIYARLCEQLAQLGLRPGPETEALWQRLSEHHRR